MSDGDETDNSGTTEADYRWKWLATVFTGLYGLGFPAWVMGSVSSYYSITVDGAMMGILTLVWLACVVYAIGPENVKAAKQIKDA